MNFARRMTRLPHPFDLERGQEAVALFPDFSPELKDAILGAAGCSPFLLSLMQRETTWLSEHLSGSPEDALACVMKETSNCAVSDLNDTLRQGKRRVALLTGLADLTGVFDLFQVTGALTDFADLSVDRALKAEIAREIARNKLPGLTEDDIATGGGMVALAMGKMGAGELNYSSDVDLICLFDETRFDPDDFHDARAAFIRATRGMSKRLNDRTAEGYVFRTDLRLRPDPSVTPVCLSMGAAERYYESVGRTWERAAHIKARPCGGDLEAGWRYLKELTPFVWRKHLDFAAIEDAHDMRLRIRDHKGFHGDISLEGHNMKLGRGGIREIEFFTQTRQIIAGGRDVDLRSRETLPALSALTQKGWVKEDVRAKLSDHYVFHRTVEHRVQMVNDAQTHDLPKSDEGFERLTAFMGYDDPAVLRREIFERLTEVHQLTESFFAPGQTSEAGNMSETTRDTIARWYSYPALRSDRAKTIFKRLQPELLQRLDKAANPDVALNHFDGFLSGLPAGVQLFSMFEANPQLIDLIVDIASTAPELSRFLGRNSQVLDAVIAGQFFEDWPGVETLLSALFQALDDLSDYEKKLDFARRWNREWHFRIGVHHLRGLIDANTAGQEYAQLAEAVLKALTPHIISEFARKHGPMPGRGAAVLGMGSLGAGRLHSHSDLDLIVIY
ncbi:MAG: glutamine-synthetase adenylyltransferase, partial [Pseudoruegeria sp.]